MLISKAISTNDIVTIKLTSSEEIVSTFIEETDKYIKIKKPRIIVPTNNGVGTMPFLYSVNDDKEISINKPVVVFELTDADLAKSYIQQTTGLSII